MSSNLAGSAPRMFATANDGASAAPPGRALGISQQTGARRTSEHGPLSGERRPAACAASCGRSPYYSADVLMSPIGIGEKQSSGSLCLIDRPVLVLAPLCLATGINVAISVDHDPFNTADCHK